MAKHRRNSYNYVQTRGSRLFKRFFVTPFDWSERIT